MGDYDYDDGGKWTPNLFPFDDNVLIGSSANECPSSPDHRLAPPIHHHCGTRVCPPPPHIAVNLFAILPC